MNQVNIEHASAGWELRQVGRASPARDARIAFASKHQIDRTVPEQHGLQIEELPAWPIDPPGAL